MKRFRNIVFGLIIFIFTIIIFNRVEYSYKTSSYKIIPKKSILAKAIIQKMNYKEDTPVTKYINIKQEKDIDNKKYILFVFGDNKELAGSAEFTKGINNKYKIEWVSHGTSIDGNEIIKTNKGKYILLTYKNLHKKVQYAKVLLNNKEFKVEFPKEEYVITFHKVPDSTQDHYIDINNIKFYTSDNVDITQEFLFEE
ncbi:hypothetical protein [Anaeromicropila herbilytica]|uniref:Uncharacterized protein n=1 Tax=Anaeromicropila herbilytica TaxID=2785025 RepID=A0A7R7EPC5_9FIRM|nr:hypothetical protein [Anaeromicropila herbilytica]BCN32240.1 hypothetical protein bsdtb5_35350 [Anaeromicropila herbilytica]